MDSLTRIKVGMSVHKSIESYLILLKELYAIYNKKTLSVCVGEQCHIVWTILDAGYFLTP